MHSYSHSNNGMRCLPQPLKHVEESESEHVTSAAETAIPDTTAAASSHKEKVKPPPRADGKKKEPMKTPPAAKPKRPVVIALFDYESNDKDEMSVLCGDRIRVLKKDPSGWWYGENPSGQKGFFPKSYTNAKD